MADFNKLKEMMRNQGKKMPMPKKQPQPAKQPMQVPDVITNRRPFKY